MKNPPRQNSFTFLVLFISIFLLIISCNRTDPCPFKELTSIENSKEHLTHIENVLHANLEKLPVNIQDSLRISWLRKIKQTAKTNYHKDSLFKYNIKINGLCACLAYSAKRKGKEFESTCDEAFKNYLCFLELVECEKKKPIIDTLKIIEPKPVRDTINTINEQTKQEPIEPEPSPQITILQPKSDSKIVKKNNNISSRLYYFGASV